MMMMKLLSINQIMIKKKLNIHQKRNRLRKNLMTEVKWTELLHQVRRVKKMQVKIISVI